MQNAETDEFYSKTNFWFRLWYITPVFVSFRMRMYVGLILSEVACITAGFGAYPEPMKPVCGEGPTTNFEFLDKSVLSNLPNLMSTKLVP